jgi:CRP/FNR family transcriptional regulator, cyclic AMP receptor protein
VLSARRSRLLSRGRRGFPLAGSSPDERSDIRFAADDARVVAALVRTALSPLRSQGSDNFRTSERRRRRDGWLVIVGFAMEETNLTSRMKNSASEGPIINGATMHKAGKAGPDLLPLPVDFASDKGADRAQLGPDCFVVEFRGVQARHEKGRAQLMARKMNGHASHTRESIASHERSSRRSKASQSRREFPVFSQPNHPLHHDSCAGDCIAASCVAVCRRADRPRKDLLQTGRAMNEVVKSAAIIPEQLAVVKSSEWFGALDTGFQQAVLGSSRVMVLAAGKSVFHRGDRSDGIYCIISGAVCFGASASSGRGSIVALAEAPQWFGEVALFDGGARTHDAWADITSTLMHLPLRHLTRILADDPSRWQQMGRLLVRKLRIALSLLEDMALEPPRVRLARCLINLFEGYGQRKAEPSCSVRVSQERLGMMLSLSRQTVNELLRHLEQESIIHCQRGGVRILDPSRLRDAAGGFS